MRDLLELWDHKEKEVCQVSEGCQDHQEPQEARVRTERTEPQGLAANLVQLARLVFPVHWATLEKSVPQVSPDLMATQVPLVNLVPAV